MKKEIFEGRYIIYSDGRVFGNKYKRFLKPRINNSGYGFVSFSINGKVIEKTVHRIIAQHFIPNPNNFPEVNHKDRNKLNNNIDNLEWCTDRQNQNHRYNSQYPGTCFNKQMKKWQANTRVNGKKKFIGYYNTQQEASDAYKSFCILHNLL